MKRTPISRRTSLRRISSSRQRQLCAYRARCAQFLLEHPFCQLWLRERGLDEQRVIERGGYVRGRRGANWIRVPRSTAVHHKNKRRGVRLLDQSQWMAVCSAAHRRIETNKQWARARGYLANF